MDVTPFSPRAAVPVGNGPTGLDSWCVVSTDPSGTLVKPAGQIAHHQRGLLGWLNCLGTAAGWVPLAALHGLVSILSTLQIIVAAWVAGGRWPVVVYDAAFNAASVTVNGLSSAKRYRFIVECDSNGFDDSIEIRPDGLIAVNNSIGFISVGGVAALPALWIGNFAEGTSRIYAGVLEPRKGGLSSWFGYNYQVGVDSLGGVISIVGATAIDFTSIVVKVSGTTRTGWLTVIEETS